MGSPSSRLHAASSPAGAVASSTRSDSDRDHNRAQRIVSLALGGVVVCLAAFSIFAAWVTQSQVAQVRQAESVHELYADAILDQAERETAELTYIIDPSPNSRIALDDANAVLADRLKAIAATGNPADAEISQYLLALHERYLVALSRELDAAASGDQSQALHIENSEVTPIVDQISSRIEAASTARESEAEHASAVLASTATVLQTLAPVLFVIGFGLLFALWRMLERDRAATERRYAQIEQLSRLRAEFVAIVSHEFRTPLTGIQGFSELMRDEDLTVAQMREYAGDINKDARRLARLIGDMLDLDRMESGQMRLHRGPVDLNHILVDAAAQLRLSAASHPVELQLDPQLPALAGDADRLTQVVTNLLNNAIKYSPGGGAIEVRTTHEQDAIVLTVRDHGIGIPADQLETVFVRYARLEAKGARAIQGTGLGLPIVRQIVEMHGGTVWATSEVGERSVLHVRLPLSESAAPARAA